MFKGCIISFLLFRKSVFLNRTVFLTRPELLAYRYRLRASVKFFQAKFPAGNKFEQVLRDITVKIKGSTHRTQSAVWCHFRNLTGIPQSNPAISFPAISHGSCFWKYGFDSPIRHRYRAAKLPFSKFHGDTIKSDFKKSYSCPKTAIIFVLPVFSMRTNPNRSNCTTVPGFTFERLVSA